MPGYPLEVHEVVTADGYLLRMERIPQPSSTDAVFMMHGERCQRHTGPCTPTHWPGPDAEAVAEAELCMKHKQHQLQPTTYDLTARWAHKGQWCIVQEIARSCMGATVAVSLSLCAGPLAACLSCRAGVLDTSLTWVAGGITGSQAFAAWDRGFDVWLGTSRSNPPHEAAGAGRQSPADQGPWSRDDLTALASHPAALKYLCPHCALSKRMKDAWCSKARLSVRGCGVPLRG